MHTRYDFYLVSQKITNNAATPTHYSVIWDNLNETTYSNSTPTIIQKFTYKLTQLSYNYSVRNNCLMMNIKLIKHIY